MSVNAYQGKVAVWQGAKILPPDIFDAKWRVRMGSNLEKGWEGVRRSSFLMSAGRRPAFTVKSDLRGERVDREDNGGSYGNPREVRRLTRHLRVVETYVLLHTMGTATRKG